jgi:hypothetical protein
MHAIARSEVGNYCTDQGLSQVSIIPKIRWIIPIRTQKIVTVHYHRICFGRLVMRRRYKKSNENLTDYSVMKSNMLLQKNILIIKLASFRRVGYRGALPDFTALTRYIAGIRTA